MNVTVEKVCLSRLVCDSLKQAFPGWGGDGTWGKLNNIWVPVVLIYKMGLGLALIEDFRGDFLFFLSKSFKLLYKS